MRERRAGGVGERRDSGRLNETGFLQRREAWVAAAADWCRQFILLHGKRQPNVMGIAEFGRFLEQPAKDALRATRATWGRRNYS